MTFYGFENTTVTLIKWCNNAINIDIYKQLMIEIILEICLHN